MNSCLLVCYLQLAPDEAGKTSLRCVLAAFGVQHTFGNTLSTSASSSEVLVASRRGD